MILNNTRPTDALRTEIQVASCNLCDVENPIAELADLVFLADAECVSHPSSLVFILVQCV